MKFFLQSRVKSLYGIYRKVYMQGRNFDEIYDVYAVRVIVDTSYECYSVLGIMHDEFTPIPKRFKDYISTPKANMYQSLHTTVLDKEGGIPFEIQIRTWEMHYTAEYGIAAHWKYKAGIEKKDKLEERLAWVRQLLEVQQDSGDAQDIVRSIKSDIAPEECFVFTPKGDVINLPTGSTVIDFACPNKGETLHTGLARWHEKADGKTGCDYGFHMTIDDWNPQIEAEIDDMYAAGISSFKMYMTYPAMMIGDNAMYHALKKLKEKGGICGVHCENSGVIDALIEEKKAAGEMGVSSHPRTRPDFLEAEAVSRLLRIAEAVDIPVVIVHLTNAAALREVEAARKRGQKVYAETCPQYLLLDDSVYDNPDYSLAARYVCAPPIRKAEDQKALWMALRRGEIQTISTDHCSFTLAQKDAGRGDFTKIPGGLPGVETRGELIYTAGVTTRKISLATMCRVLAENPAKLYGMFPRKGILQAGADADIVVYDPLADHVIRAADMVANVDYNPYEGFTTRGSIQQVWLRGRLAVEHGTVLAGPDGKYILRGKNCL